MPQHKIARKRIALRSLDPYPETREKILSSDYRAALLLNKD
jgi:hypothetical protein